MSFKTERENFIAKWCAQAVTGRQTVEHTARGPVVVHVAAGDARTMLRYARTLQRLAEAQCNGDYPADNGQRETVACPGCETQWAPEVLKRDKVLTAGICDQPGISCTRAYRDGLKFCPDCRTVRKVKELADKYGYIAQVGGDPRGYVVKLWPAGTDAQDMDRTYGWGVPA